jgi:shikimate dehydrogenase
MTRCGVLGDPIAHSLSPVLHRAAFAELGLDWTYDAVQVPGGTLESFLAGLDESWRGLSLTMPLKRELVPLADEVSDVARLAGAANTLVLANGRRLAHNTDVPGAASAIRERYDGRVDTATILGGGATATSVGLALADLGCREISVLARSAERATETVAAVASHPSAPSVHYAELAEAEVVGDVLVSTIPASAQAAGLVARCARVPVVFDVTYHPWPTPLAQSLMDRPGERTLVSGLDLLVHQAALQVELFTGLVIPVEVLRSAGEAALAG